MIKDRRAGTLQGIVLILPITLSTMGSVLLAPIVPQLMQAFGHIENANYWVPLLLSLPALCIALGAPLAGYIADKVGRRQLLIASMFVYAVCGVSPLFLDSYWMVFGSRLLVGVCEAFLMTCSTTLIGDYFKGDDRNKWLGSQAAVASLTAMCLFPLAGYLGATYGWKGPFALYALSLPLAVMTILFTWETGSQSDEEVQSEARVTKHVNRFPWGHMGTVCGFTLIGGILFYLLQFQMAAALGEFDIDNSAITGWLLSFASIGVPMGAIAYRYIHQWLGLKNLIALEFGILALGFFSMASAPDYKIFVAAGFLNQFGAGMLLPTMLTWAVKPLSHAVRARGAGIWQSTFATGQFVTTLVFAWVLANLANGSHLESFRVFAGVALAMFVISIVTLPKKNSGINSAIKNGA